MIRLGYRSLTLVILFGSMFSVLILAAAAAEDKNSWEFIAGYNYFHLRDDLPEAYRDYLEPDSKTADLEVGFSTGNDKGQFSMSLDGKGNSDAFETNLKEFSWSEKANRTLYEIGKAKWVWGRGLSYIPTCPLDKDTYYWGLQSSIIHPGHSFTIGAAVDDDSFYSNDNNNNIKTIDSENGYYGWLREGWVFDTSDLTAIMAYQSVKNYWNYGLDFSRDLLNGFELHGGFNFRSPDSKVKYLIGGEYSGKYFYLMEFYHEADDQLILSMSNSTNMLGSWQWELREIYDFNDEGEIRQFNIKYIKINNIVPELDISMNVGPKDSMYRQNPFDYSASLKVTMKF